MFDQWLMAAQKLINISTLLLVPSIEATSIYTLPRII
jgi:hypothetical protein